MQPKLGLLKKKLGDGCLRVPFAQACSVTDFGRFDGVPGLGLKLGRGLVVPKASGGQTRGMTTPNDVAAILRIELEDIESRNYKLRRRSSGSKTRWRQIVPVHGIR